MKEIGLIHVLLLKMKLSYTTLEINGSRWSSFVSKTLDSFWVGHAIQMTKSSKKLVPP